MKKGIKHYLGLGAMFFGLLLELPGQTLIALSVVVFLLGKALEYPFRKLEEWGARITDDNDEDDAEL